MVSDHEARLEKIETDLTHAMNTIDELNSVVIDQNKQLDRVTRALANMTDQVEELMENVLPAHQIDKPPHY